MCMSACHHHHHCHRWRPCSEHGPFAICSSWFWWSC
jgi:hypothetical protein